MASKTFGKDDALSEEILKGLSPEAQALLAMQARLIDELRESRTAQPEAFARANKEINKKENAVGPAISVFNPRGEREYPLPALKCEIYAPWRIHPAYHGLTREEVELFNLLEPCESKIELVDGTDQRVVILGQRHHLTGALTRLTFSGPLNEEGKQTPLWTMESKGLYPSMVLILRQILGTKADAVVSMKQEQTSIEAGELPVSVGV